MSLPTIGGFSVIDNYDLSEDGEQVIYCAPCFIDNYHFEAQEVLNELGTDFIFLALDDEPKLFCSNCGRGVN